MNTGTGAEQEVRCRLVARDRKPKGEKEREDLFAATSPLEGKKLPLHMAAMQCGVSREAGAHRRQKSPLRRRGAGRSFLLRC